MRSYGQLWERVASPENLSAALGRVMKGRGAKRDVAAFAARAGDELAALRGELLSGAWRPGPYGQFRVTDPKPRTISCAPVRDRVVHHALCGVIAPLLERGFTEDCYACRVGMGTHRAAARARELVRRNAWACKLDIRHYFDSVPHDRLLELLLPIFREKEVCRMIEVIVRQPVPGLPEGRGLEIKGERTVTAPVSEGLAFLGLRIFPGGWRFQRTRLLRTRRKFRLRERQWLAGEIDDVQLAMCAAATEGGVRWYGFRGILQSLGVEDSEGIWAGGEGADSGSNRVKRGGSWNNTASKCRSGYRNDNGPSSRNNNIGFRLVSTMRPKGQAGSHPPAPAPRGGGDEQARLRAAGSPSV